MHWLQQGYLRSHLTFRARHGRHTIDFGAVVDMIVKIIDVFRNRSKYIGVISFMDVKADDGIDDEGIGSCVQKSAHSSSASFASTSLLVRMYRVHL